MTSATRRATDERTARSGGSASSPPAGIRPADHLAAAVSSVGVERWTRLVAVAAVPWFHPDVGGELAGVYGAVTVYVLVTALARRDRFVRGADLVVAAALITATGGQVAPFLLFLAVAVAGPASVGGPMVGAAAGTGLSLVLLAVLGLEGQLAQFGWDVVVPASLLLPLTGVAVASAERRGARRPADVRSELVEEDPLRSALLAVAGDPPGGLDVRTVAAGVLAELRRLPGTATALVFVEDGGVLRLAAATGGRADDLPSVRVDVARRLGDLRLRTSRQLPAGVRDAVGDEPFWLGAQFGRGDQPLGLLLVGLDAAEAAPGLRTPLAALAVAAATALRDARRLDDSLVRAAEAARRRLAADLHDGVAQSLAHLKMELELQTVAGGRRSADAELGRLAHLAGTALADLRATIAGLSVSDEPDLAVLLRTHLEEVASSGGPDLGFEAAGSATLRVARREDLLRIAQEAVSNALRHAQATTVTVSLEGDERIVELVVEDDGVGRAATSRRAGGGVGLRSMAERAERLGGTLTVRDRLGGGTVVVVRCPPDGALPTDRPVGSLG